MTQALYSSLVYSLMKDTSHDNVLALQLVSSKKFVNMKEPVESDQDDTFLQEVIHEWEQDLYEGLSQSQSNLLIPSELIQVMNQSVVKAPKNVMLNRFKFNGASESPHLKLWDVYAKKLENTGDQDSLGPQSQSHDLESPSLPLAQHSLQGGCAHRGG